MANNQTQFQPGNDRNAQVTVIVPVYNKEEYLRECVGSILAQTYPNVEILLVNDGSSDNSGIICAEFAAEHDNLKIINQPNGGAASARNKGLQNATGEYVCFVDADDVIHPEMIESLVDILERTNSDIVETGFMAGGIANKMIKCSDIEIVLSGEDRYMALFSNRLGTSVCTKIFKKAAIDNLKFREGIINEDFLFLSDMFTRPGTLVISPRTFYKYRLVNDSVTHTINDKFFDVVRNLDVVRSVIAEQSEVVREQFEVYALQINIFAGLRVVQHRLNRKYKHYLRRCRAEIRRKWKTVLFDRRMSMRWRIKAAAVFLHLP